MSIDFENNKFGCHPVNTNYLSKLYVNDNYKRPKPKKSYKVKIQITEKVKGKPINYGE